MEIHSGNLTSIEGAFPIKKMGVFHGCYVSLPEGTLFQWPFAHLPGTSPMNGSTGPSIPGQEADAGHGSSTRWILVTRHGWKS